MRKKITISSLFILVFILSMGIESSKVIAQDMVDVTAVARVVYESFSADTQKKAINLAKKTALKKYFRKLPTAKKRQLKAFEGEFYKNMDDFITEVKIQQEKNDEEKNTFAVAIVASIDPGAIDAFFVENSAAGNQNVGESSDFGAMFIARTESERKSFDAKRTSVVETDSSQSQVAEDASSDSRSVTSSREKTFDLKKPVNLLEKTEDKSLKWRKYVNKQLETKYKKLFNKLDVLIYLKVRNFRLLRKWRLKQEKKLSLQSKNKKRVPAKAKTLITIIGILIVLNYLSN